MSDVRLLKSKLPQLADLSSLPRDQLVALWEEYLGRPPPKAASTALILRAVAYAIQVKGLGGLRKQDQRALIRIAASHQGNPKPIKCRDGAMPEGASPVQGNVQGIATLPPARLARPALRPGTRLVRNWQGQGHVVDVYQEGFGWNGKIYKSLTSIAIEITGVHWSGPRFFRT